MPGRKPKPIDPGAPPAAAQFGRALRERRLEAELTQTALGDRAGITAQHISGLELAKAHPTKRCVTALDAALEANGVLLALVDAVLRERVRAIGERRAARLCSETVAVGSAVHRNAGDDDVDPTTRLELIEAGAAAALGAPVLGAVPARAGEVDPGLVDHWTNLLRLLGRLDMLRGPQDVLAAVCREIDLMAQHRRIARGPLRVALMRVEARWCDFAAWLSEDTGRPSDRDAWTERAGRLAQEAGDLELVAFWWARRGEWAAMSHRARAAEFAEAALAGHGVSAQTRAWSARQAALGYALGGATAACERRLHDAYTLLERTDSPVPPWAHEFRVTRSGTQATEACCWLLLTPGKAISVYEDALRNWPPDEVRDRGLHGARMALACAKAGELDRAKVEAARAFAVYKQTQSASAARELRQLGAVLNAA